MKKMRFIASLACLVSVLLLLTGCGGAKKIDLTEYTEIHTSGYDGKGTAKLVVDWGKLDEAAFADSKMNPLAALAASVELQESIKYSIDKTEGLSNGDKISLSVKWDDDVAKKYKLKLGASQWQMTVSGLDELKTVDLFADIHVEFEGVSPEAKAILRNASSDGFIKNIRYSVDRTRDISNGDTIVVKAEITAEAAEKSGYAIGQVEKTFTVSGIDEYIRSYDMLDRETQAKMERHARDIIDATFATPRGLVDELYPGQWIFIWDEIGFMNSLDVREINLIHTYFLTLKKGLQRGYRESMNATFFVYEVKFTTNRTNKDGIDVVYLPVYYTDIIKRDSGALDVILTNAGISNKKSSTLENVYRDIVTANKAKYDCEEIE